jgi:flagellar motor switch/type III secretory pathway protein FliN
VSQKDARDPGFRFAGFESIPLAVTVSVGGTRCKLGQLCKLEPGDLIHLDRKIGDPFELRAGGVLLARVEPVAHGEGIAVKLVGVPEEEDGPSR